MNINDLCEKLNINKNNLKDHNFIYVKERMIMLDQHFGINNYICNNCDVILYEAYTANSNNSIIQNSVFIFKNNDKQPNGSKNLVCLFDKNQQYAYYAEIIDKSKILTCREIIIKQIIE